MSEPTDKQQLLQNYLADRDEPCPQCGYNLRALTGDRCPECGEQLVLSVQLVEPKQAALIAGLLGLAAGAGMNGLLIIYLIIRLLFLPRNMGTDFWPKFICVNLIPFIILSGLALVWLKKWRAIRAAPIKTKTLLVMLCWLLTLVDIIIFSIVID